jgi:hypothetical protein
VDEAAKQREDRFGFAGLTQVGHAARAFGLLTAAGTSNAVMMMAGRVDPSFFNLLQPEDQCQPPSSA